MRNIKLVSVQIVSLGLLLVCASGMAFGQSNFRGFHRMHPGGNGGNPPTPPPPPADPSTTPNPNCSLLLPPNPLTATGLSTPFQLFATDMNAGECHEANNAQSAFAQAAIFDPATNQISIYNPLIIDQGTSPAAAPVVPVIPVGATVALWFGYNADNLTLVAAPSTNLTDANCVNGTPGSVFSQYSYCNAAAFFTAANSAIASGQLKVPPLGTAVDGMSCPTVRDFFVVDQDQSDNLPTTYLISADGLIAQYTKINFAKLTGAIPLGNPSDNRLTDVFLDGALQCQPWTAPDLADPGAMVAALPLNELQARMEQPTPVALVPAGDPMAEVSGTEDMTKLNLYRMGVDQPTADSSIDGDTSRYCRQMLRIAPRRMFRDQALLTSFNKNPDPGAANSLFMFLAQRFVASYGILNCESLIHKEVPITITTDSNGVAIHATLNIFKYIRELEDIASQKTADDRADSAKNSLLLVE
jgi:hypothetical protein